eukprot:GHVT01023371.1.p1 GENE.GHVT01023371.1~~GHVT01023371.1.p1  ORF type:complete len:639 (-),score=126.73 GHVT01023371.1:1429-3345(-)
MMASRPSLSNSSSEVVWLCVAVAALKLADVGNERAQEYYKTTNLREYAEAATARVNLGVPWNFFGPVPLLFDVYCLRKMEYQMLEALEFRLIFPTRRLYLDGLWQVVAQLQVPACHVRRVAAVACRCCHAPLGEEQQLWPLQSLRPRVPPPQNLASRRARVAAAALTGGSKDDAAVDGSRGAGLPRIRRGTASSADCAPERFRGGAAAPHPRMSHDHAGGHTARPRRRSFTWDYQNGRDQGTPSPHNARAHSSPESTRANSIQLAPRPFRNGLRVEGTAPLRRETPPLEHSDPDAETPAQAAASSSSDAMDECDSSPRANRPLASQLRAAPRDKPIRCCASRQDTRSNCTCCTLLPSSLTAEVVLADWRLGICIKLSHYLADLSLYSCVLSSFPPSLVALCILATSLAIGFRAPSTDTRRLSAIDAASVWECSHHRSEGAAEPEPGSLRILWILAKLRLLLILPSGPPETPEGGAPTPPTSGPSRAGHPGTCAGLFDGFPPAPSSRLQGGGSRYGGSSSCSSCGSEGEEDGGLLAGISAWTILRCLDAVERLASRGRAMLVLQEAAAAVGAGAAQFNERQRQVHDPFPSARGSPRLPQPLVALLAPDKQQLHLLRTLLRQPECRHADPTPIHDPSTIS